jgi:hypothetical protein
LVFVGSCGDTQVGNQGEVATPLTETPDYKAQSPEKLTDNDAVALRIAMIKEIQESAPADYVIGKQASPRAENRAHRLRAVFEPAGIRVEKADWAERLELLAYGYDGELKETTHGKRSVRRNRVEYLRDPDLTEWFLNGPLGIEHGFTVQSPPSGRTQASDLVFEIGVSGDLHPRQLKAGKSIAFLAAGGAQAFQYREAYAQDADGKLLPVSMNLNAASERVIIRVNDEGAVYPLTIDPLIVAETKLLPPISLEQSDYFGRWRIGLSGNTAVIGAPGDDDNGGSAGAAYVFDYSGSAWTLTQKLIGADTNSLDIFGSAVAIDADTIVVGAPGDEDEANQAGSAFVFVRSGGVWTQQAKLLAGDGEEWDRFGESVDIDGDSVVVGCDADDETADTAGAAYVFVRSGVNWTLEQKLLAGDGAADERFGHDVAISGDTVVVGADAEDDVISNRGAAYVYTRSLGVWTEQQKLVASDAGDGDFFGSSVDIELDTVAVGSTGDDDVDNNAGAVYVFTRSGSTWTEDQKLFGSDSDASAQMGTDVALSGTSLLAGGENADGVGISTGAAWVFLYSGGTWTEQAKLQAPDGVLADYFGRVALDGDLAVVSAWGDDDSGDNCGSAYMFSRSGGTWTLDVKLLEPGAAEQDRFGSSVGVDGPIAMIGSVAANFAGNDSGAAWAYYYDGSGWSKEALITPPDSWIGDLFGVSVAVSGDTAIIGASGDDDKGSSSGSAYVYIRNLGVWTLQQKLTASDGAASDYFGRTVAIDGDVAVVGSNWDDDLGDSSGSAYVFTRSGNTWTEEAKLLASDGAAGDYFGFSVAVSGNTVVVGASRRDEVNTDAGAAYVFTGSGGVWTQQAKLTASTPVASANFGDMVAIDGDTALIGEPLGGASPRTGAVYVFTRSGGVWTQQVRLLASDAAQWDRFGAAMAINGDKLAIGAWGDDAPTTDMGSVYIFVYAQGAWGEEKKITASDYGNGDRFGQSVDISGNRLGVGAPFEDENGTDVGAAYVYDLTFAVNGTPCISGGECASRYCVDGFCCNTPCGGAAVDCQTCSFADGATADGTCTLLGAGAVCRAAAGTCDIEEVCNGVATTCPADGLVAGGTVCRSSAGDCDVAETCTGSDAACPGDGFLGAGNECRPSAGVCDVAESCTGSSAACPVNGFRTAGFQCRGSVGICDVAETCTGSSATCPSDGFVAAGTECRASAGICDVAESCTGSSAPCPVNGFVAAGTECRASGGICDLAESCTGSSPTCPADVLVAAGTECRGSVGLCDVPESCTGVTTACPPDIFVPAGLVCRASAGVCDVAESCTGSAAACPGDAFVSAGTVCRDISGLCDFEEFCTGSSADCPVDSFAPAGTECRPSAGICDVAELCSGSSADCPLNFVAPPDTECRPSAGSCDVAENCTGTSSWCPPDVLVPAGLVCRPVTGLCDVAESCTGGDAACPGDGFVAAGTDCRPSAGICDVAEACTGGDAACPGDGFVSAGTECRGSAGICDVVESCTGSDAACPVDSFVAAGTECRGSAGTCDAAESCTGGSAACPADVLSPDGTPCNDSLYCRVNDRCVSGMCMGSSRDCDDSDSCTSDTCDEANNRCTHQLVPNPGAEGPAGHPTCSDSMDNDCDGQTDDVDPDCRNCVVNSDCDDNNDCTINTCAGGLCQTSSVVDGSTCDDGLYCTVQDSCTGGVCGGGVRDCSAMSGPCTSGLCDDVGDACIAMQLGDGTPCDDGLYCSENDQCSSGACTGSPRNCTDGNACTVDSCDEAAGCLNDTPVDCDDGDACTVDTCDTATGCVNTAADCDDGDACTLDSCDAGSGCTNTPVDCDDSDACTVDSCDTTTGCDNSTPVDCDDGDACTVDICDPATGCDNSTPTDCDDGDACTQDLCDPSTGCSNDTPVDCDDGDACTVDTCDPATGCNSDTPVDCDDGDECTEDGCDSANGCFNTQLPDGAACTNGTCQSGVCVTDGTDGGVDGGADGGPDGGQDAGADEGKPAGGGCGCGTGTDPTGLGFVLVLPGLLFYIRRKKEHPVSG